MDSCWLGSHRSYAQLRCEYIPLARWSWSHSPVLGLFAIALQCAKITAQVILHCPSWSVTEVHSPPSWLITQIPSWGLWNDILGIHYYSLFCLCLSGEGVTCFVAWPQLPLHILFGSTALANATVVCGFAHICPFFRVSPEVLLTTLSFLIQCPLCPPCYWGKTR